MDEGLVAIYLQSTDPSYGEAAAAFLVATITDAQVAASGIFGWPIPAELEGLWNRAQAMRQGGTPSQAD